MKHSNLNFLVLLFFGIGLIINTGSCTKEKPDPCEQVICLNGGVCEDGSCACPDGFSGPRCENDPCKGVNCRFGDCVNGSCECDEMYTGPNCDEPREPKKIMSSLVQLESIPNACESWDNSQPFNSPDGDIFIVIKDGNSTIYNTRIQYKPNTNCSGPNGCIFTLPIELRPKRTYKLMVYDRDVTNADDLIMTFTFKPWTSMIFVDHFYYDDPSKQRILEHSQGCWVSGPGYSFSGDNFRVNLLNVQYEF